MIVLVLERKLVMYCEEVNPMSRRSAEALFAQDHVEKIEEALLRVTFHDEDWRWVQFYCLKFLEHPNKDVRAIAAICLGHLACIHGTIDTAIVVPALQAHLTDPDVAGNALDALDDIAMFVEKAR
ncbi:MAG: hypothetical protein NVS4B12_22820 [Ktedonobacteraceae bacterium]